MEQYFLCCGYGKISLKLAGDLSCGLVVLFLGCGVFCFFLFEEMILNSPLISFWPFPGNILMHHRRT